MIIEECRFTVVSVELLHPRLVAGHSRQMKIRFTVPIFRGRCVKLLDFANYRDKRDGAICELVEWLIYSFRVRIDTSG
ncbi:hypothetical protein TcWFU_001178 [Taenia crassiceps]|uniref:Uncharacterized protein n=1 Tax=Taenia crassiceps TaxID=6207 RepID=A0ABR4QNW8_9CEST